jgi:hypothetical protein
MRARQTIAFTNRPAKTIAWRCAASFLMLYPTGCGNSGEGVDQTLPETGSNLDAGVARNIFDGSAWDAVATHAGAQGEVLVRADASPFDASVHHEAGTTPAANTSHDDASTYDGGATWGSDARSVAVTSDAATCEVDACDYAGTCIRRDWWTECTCDPHNLPRCDFPRFREIGPSRTDRERTLYLISGDGHVVAGTHSFDTSSQTSVGVTWTLEKGLQALPQDPAGPTIPTGVNFDGSLITGVIELDHAETRNVVWRDGILERVSPDAGTPPTGGHSARIPLDGTPLTRYFEVLDATEDGNLIVGRTRRSNDNSRTEAAFWTPDDGVRFLRDHLTALGVDMNSWDLWHVNAVSDDGNTMMGLGIGPDVGYRWYLQLAATQR